MSRNERAGSVLLRGSAKLEGREGGKVGRKEGGREEKEMLPGPRT